MKHMLINIVAFATAGQLLAMSDMGITTWQYWSIIGLMLVVQVNSTINQL